MRKIFNNLLKVYNKSTKFFFLFLHFISIHTKILIETYHARSFLTKKVSRLKIESIEKLLRILF